MGWRRRAPWVLASTAVGCAARCAHQPPAPLPLPHHSHHPAAAHLAAGPGRGDGGGQLHGLRRHLVVHRALWPGPAQAGASASFSTQRCTRVHSPMGPRCTRRRPGLPRPRSAGAMHARSALLAAPRAGPCAPPALCPAPPRAVPPPAPPTHHHHGRLCLWTRRRCRTWRRTGESRLGRLGPCPPRGFWAGDGCQPGLKTNSKVNSKMSDHAPSLTSRLLALPRSPHARLLTAHGRKWGSTGCFDLASLTRLQCKLQTGARARPPLENGPALPALRAA